MKEKYLGVDFGDARTGLALSEPTGLLAVGAGCIRCGNLRKTAEQTAAFAKEQGVAKIIIGKPLNMNGTEGPKAQECREFAAQLQEKCGLEVVLWDEPASTVTANRILSDAGKKRDKQRSRVDAVAAQVILQSYLDFWNMQKNRG